MEKKRRRWAERDGEGQRELTVLENKPTTFPCLENLSSFGHPSYDDEERKRDREKEEEGMRKGRDKNEYKRTSFYHSFLRHVGKSVLMRGG
jgi:hypothetical protein